jgi:hypothetical protein
MKSLPSSVASHRHENPCVERVAVSMMVGTDAAARRFTTRHQFIALLFAQFCGGSLPREVESVMPSRQASRGFLCPRRAPRGNEACFEPRPDDCRVRRNSDGCAPNRRSADKRGPRAPPTGGAGGKRSAPHFGALGTNSIRHDPRLRGRTGSPLCPLDEY